MVWHFGERSTRGQGSEILPRKHKWTEGELELRCVSTSASQGRLPTILYNEKEFLFTVLKKIIIMPSIIL